MPSVPKKPRTAEQPSTAQKSSRAQMPNTFQKRITVRMPSNSPGRKLQRYLVLLSLLSQMCCVESDAVVTSISVERNTFHDPSPMPPATSPPPPRRNGHHGGYGTVPTPALIPRPAIASPSHTSRGILQKLLEDSRGSTWNPPFRDRSSVENNSGPFFEEVRVSSNVRSSPLSSSFSSKQSSIRQENEFFRPETPSVRDLQEVSSSSSKSAAQKTSAIDKGSVLQSEATIEENEAVMPETPITESLFPNGDMSTNDSSSLQVRLPLFESLPNSTNRSANDPSNETDHTSTINTDDVDLSEDQSPTDSPSTSNHELENEDDDQVDPVNELPSRRGVLKVRITEFLNPSNKDADGNCCMKDTSSSACGGYCRLFFRVCATHSSRNVVLPQRATPPPKHPGTFRPTTVPPDDTTDGRSLFSMPSLEAVRHKMMSSRRAEGVAELVSTTPKKKREEKRSFDPNVPCTLGLIVTEVVANSSLRANVEGALDITFPFTSDWPVSFRIIVEAWHDVTGFLFNSSQPPLSADRAGTLVARHASRLSVVAGQAWQTQRRVMTHAASIIYGVRVACVPPYTGARCTLPDNTVTEGASNASIRGNCGATSSSHGVCGPDGKLRCRAGWTGKLCDQPMCSAGCNKQHGFCTKPGECICQMGWRGDRCDECIPLPGCQHGSCNGTSFTCHCHEGWTGTHCSQAVCREGCHTTRGYCENPGECKCRIGWGGPTCEECAVVPGCQNGYCRKPLECRCKPGWTGNLCQTPVCAEGCHPEHGTCKQPGECRCEVGWYGPQCSTCHPYPGCKNGHCTKPWECICDPGWTGMTCDKRIERISGYCDANSNACLNGGTCIDVLGPRNYTCSCPSLFTGMRCDYLADRRSKPSTSPSTTTTTTPASKKSKSLLSTTTTLTTAATTSTTMRSTTFRRTKSTTVKPTTSSASSISEAEEDDYDTGFEDYEDAPRGQHSLIHSVTASPKKFKQQKEQREIDAKNARRLFLQKQATITFRQPKIVPTIRTRSRPLKLPFTVIDRKHLSLPVFLPRVSDVVRKNITMSKNETQNDTAGEDENKRPSSQTIGLLKKLSRPGKRNRDDNSSSTRREILFKKKSSFFTLSTPPTTETPDSQATSTISTTQTTTVSSSTVASNVSRRPEKIESTVSPVKISSGESSKNFESILDSPLPWKQEQFKSPSKGEQTIKDLLEGYEKPQPVLVVDYDDPNNDENLNDLQKANDNKIEGSLNFLNENRRYLEPESLNLASENSQESSSNGPSRPMFLVAVRPIPHPDGSVRPIGAGGNPLINFSRGNYPSATFLGESRNGKFLPHGRSVGSGRGPIHFSSPSFSVSNPSGFNLRHFAPQTRLSRRIGHASSVAPITQVFSEEDSRNPSDSSTSSSEKKSIHFYEEHSDGSVHIGVDRHTPQEEIINAFIEIKKARP